jgi:DNA mismatch repair protein MutS
MMAPPLNATFIHRQTTANQVRFTTVELSALETRILNAGNHALDLEKGHFADLRAHVLAQAGAIGQAASGLAELDVIAALADLALSEDWVRPRVDASHAFQIEGGRHPVVEAALRRQGAPFIANDCALTEGDTPAIWLLTGPNMAGKSTFLRQNALIALLAQRGLSCRRGRHISGWSASCSAGSAPRTIWRGAGPPSWWRWWRRPRF